MSANQLSDAKKAFFYLRIVGVVAIGCLILLIWSLNHQQKLTLDAEYDLQEVPETSAPAQRLTEKQQVNLQQLGITLNSKLVIINEWQAWCKPCIKEIPAFEALLAKFEDNELQVILVNTDPIENQQEAKGIMSLLPIKEASVLYTQTTRGLHAFRAEVLPSTWLISKNGKLLGYWPGAYDWGSITAEQYLRQKLQQLELPD